MASIAYDKVACAIRKLFGDAVDESQAVKGRTYWQADGWDDGDYEDGAADFLHGSGRALVNCHGRDGCHRVRR